MKINNLRKYVSEANPIVNQLLRSDMDASEYTFDSLFEKGIIPQPLYRFINNENVHIEDGIFTDKGYLSCTSNFESFINHIEGVNIACLQFDIADEFKRIDVHALLPDFNDESEIILPKGLRFRLLDRQTYSTRNEIEDFLNKVESISSVNEICDIYKIRTIQYYKLAF